MYRVAYTPDGRLLMPPTVTIYVLHVWNACCNSHSRVEASSLAECWTMYYEGRRAGVYGSVIGDEQYKGRDPRDMAVYYKELARINATSCLLLEDVLRMRVWVKALPAERVEEIDPTWYKGHGATQAFLREQIAHKREECRLKGIYPKPDTRHWWEKGRPWNISTP